MPKLRKQRRRQKFKFNINRKKLYKKSKQLPAITCNVIKKEWEEHKSTTANLRSMGLVADVNKDIVMNTEVDPMKVVKLEKKRTPLKAHVSGELEKEAKAPRVSKFQLPKGEVLHITYFIDKYGEDYKAMAKDKCNVDQHTWKQIRAKINTFKKIPEQYNKYLQERAKKMEIDNYDEVD